MFFSCSLFVSSQTGEKLRVCFVGMLMDGKLFHGIQLVLASTVKFSCQGCHLILNECITHYVEDFIEE